MKILIVTRRLAKRTGTEIVTRDFVKALQQSGHETAVLTEFAGAFAEEVRRIDARVFTASSELDFVPDIAHFNHAVFVNDTFEKFPFVAGIYQHHAPGEKASHDVCNSCFRFRFGVSPLACQQIRRTTGGSDDGWLGNYVDLDLLTGFAQPRWRPKRWLVICQKKRCFQQLWLLSRLAWRHGASLKAVGPRVLRRVPNVRTRQAT